MKFTMVIADDEPVVLKSEELFIKKEFPDIEIVGMAENGIELKQMLEQRKPDMAMVDIHMPGLSGIEVIELLQHRNCATHFIINTAYSDFEYVKKALDLKTDGYLLKPAKQEERIATIRRLCQAIEDEKKETIRQNSLKSALGVVNLVLGSEILLSVFSEKQDEEGFQAYCNINNIEFNGGCIVTFLSKEKKELNRKLLNDELEKALDGLCNFLATITEQGVVVMLFVPRELERERQREWCRDLAKLVADRLEQALGIKYMYGVGEVYVSFSDMGKSWRGSREELGGHYRETAEPEAVNADKIHMYVQKTKQYIENNYWKDIALIDCAGSVGISPYYLSHIFKERTGQTFVEYLSQVRIQEAKRLCRNTNLTINEIAERSGYFNTTYFCKVFKGLTGKTIGEYRKSEADKNSIGKQLMSVLNNYQKIILGRSIMSTASDIMRREWAINDAKRDAGLTTPEDIERFDTIQYGSDPKWNVLDVYRPKTENGKLPVIVSVHGGGWVYGDKELYQFYCMSLAQRKFAVINFTYRLAPETKYPAPLEDTNWVLEWMYENQENYGLDMENVFMVGDSAGGHLAGLYAAICTNPEYAKNYDFKVPAGFVPKALGLNCGAYVPLGEVSVVGETQDEELMGDFLPEKGSERERRLINVPDHVTENYPPVYLMTCVGDFCKPQAPLLEKVLKEKQINHKYVIYGDEENPLYHVFHVTVQEPMGQKCNDDECEFFREMMK